jgi:hypothetical protein
MHFTRLPEILVAKHSSGELVMFQPLLNRRKKHAIKEMMNFFCH